MTDRISALRAARRREVQEARAAELAPAEPLRYQAPDIHRAEPESRTDELARYQRFGQAIAEIISPRPERQPIAVNVAAPDVHLRYQAPPQLAEDKLAGALAEGLTSGLTKSLVLPTDEATAAGLKDLAQAIRDSARESPDLAPLVQALRAIADAFRQQRAADLKPIADGMVALASGLKALAVAQQETTAKLVKALTAPKRAVRDGQDRLLGFAPGPIE